MKLETVGKVLTGGFGDRALVGFLMGLLDRVSPARCCEYIKNDMEFLHWAKEADLAKYQKWAKRARIQDISRERINAELKKYHPELWQVIHDTPGGPAWFDRQIEQMRQKLGLS